MPQPTVGSSRGSRSIIQSAREEPKTVLDRLGSSVEGLSDDEALRRLAIHGENVLRPHERESPLAILLRACRNPLVVLLGILATGSFTAGDTASGILMLAMLAIGVGLRAVQEWRADVAVAALRERLHVHATVIRAGRFTEIPIGRLVPGDVVQLAAGDMVPADVRLIASRGLFVTEAVLTGESFPVEKSAEPEPSADDPLALRSVCHLGASVESGSARAVVVETGRRTCLGGMAASLDLPELPTAFDVGLERFTWLMVGFVAVISPLVFLVNGLVRGDWWEALFFSLAVAVGLTPEMLPMIVGVCLSHGAIGMSRKRVIVRHLDAIQNLGAMDVLCTDKTGTLTLDRIILERHCDVRLREDPAVLELAWLNAHFQTGLKNLLDRAILEHELWREHVPHRGEAKIDEIPFDFSRRAMSVVVRLADGRRRLICKGAADALFQRCDRYEVDGVVHPLDGMVSASLAREEEKLGREGFRVLAVAYKDVEKKTSYSRDDEHGLVLRGYVAFLDPPKDSAREAVAKIRASGVEVKVLTGDNEFVGGSVCRAVGLDVGRVLLGNEVERLDDESLAVAARGACLLARLTPAQKERVVRLLRGGGHVVGFLGDGANDAPALRAADVAITVDSAVDVARESADCMLLDKDLRVLRDGIIEGRRVFMNVLKYIRMGASSNFGNTISVVGASLLLPFLPMTPLQVLANNLLYDCSQVSIPTDEVDPELVARPRPWSVRQVSRFILLVGPISSLFDFTTFAVLLFGFGCVEPGGSRLFHTGWFVESLVTQTLVIHVIRTDRIPFFASRASPAVAAATAAVVLVAAWLPASPLGPSFGFVPLPTAYWPFLAATAVAYAFLTHFAKAAVVRRGWLEM